MLALLLLACKAPPSAPVELDELCAWLFAHHEDDEAVLAAGLDHLAEQVEARREALLEGYAVGGIDAAAAEALDDGDHEVDGIFGVALLSELAHTPAEAAGAMVLADQEDVHPGRYEDYETRFVGDAECFVAGLCESVEVEAWYTAHLFLGINSDNHDWHQYRWVEAGGGRVLAHRAWLVEPPAVTGGLVDVRDQYYLDLFLPTEAGLDRLQASWIVLGGDAMPESAVQSMLVQGMTEHSDNVEAWLDGETAGR